jgi:hypothetical protein
VDLSSRWKGICEKSAVDAGSRNFRSVSSGALSKCEFRHAKIVTQLKLHKFLSF